MFNVIHDQAELTGEATGLLDAENNKILISMDVEAPLGVSYKSYAEVWGSKIDANGVKASVPISWIGGVVQTANENGKTVVTLELDVNWVTLSGASEPFILKNVRLQDLDTSIPLSCVCGVEVKMNSPIASYLSSASIPIEITDEMLMGKRPSSLSLPSENATESATQFVLIHGYCSETNPWQKSTGDFTNGHYFVNPKASIGHDQFAKLVHSFAEGRGASAYSILGHSQGGPVSVHLHNYYWSGLDNAPTSGRLIQSVGSPYQGCSAAGTLANIGKIFGIGCGANNDLTIDGSSAWIKGITTRVRAKTYYYTTTYLRDQFFGDYCNLAIQLILAFPNDGTAELDYTGLPGAINLGNTEQQCHTEGMKYTAQYLDHNRNRVINTNAAR